MIDMTIPRVGHWMHTSAGKPYWPLSPRNGDVDIEVVAHALSNICRFGGHTRRFYSVAEHSWHCSFIGPDDEALERLLHDAAEAYVGDIIRPLKYSDTIRAPYAAVEALNERVVAERFGLRYPWPASVKRADEAVVTAEMDQLFDAVDKGTMHDASVTADIKVRCWSPDEAYSHFMGRYVDLTARRAA
jgi:hypothetical protein